MKIGKKEAYNKAFHLAHFGFYWYFYLLCLPAIIYTITNE